MLPDGTSNDFFSAGFSTIVDVGYPSSSAQAAFQLDLGRVPERVQVTAFNKHCNARHFPPKPRGKKSGIHGAVPDVRGWNLFPRRFPHR
jgi:hypothetical protein